MNALFALILVSTVAAGCSEPTPALTEGSVTVTGETSLLVPTPDGGLLAIGSYQLDNGATSVLRVYPTGKPATHLDGVQIAGGVDRGFPAGDATGDVILYGRFQNYGSWPARGLVRIDQYGAHVASYTLSQAITDLAPSGQGRGDVFVRTDDDLIIRLDAALVPDPSFQVQAAGSALFGLEDGGVLSFSAHDEGYVRRFDADGNELNVMQPLYFERLRTAVSTTDGSGDILLTGIMTYYHDNPHAKGFARVRPSGEAVTSFAPPESLGLTRIHVMTAFPAADGTGDVWAMTHLGPFGSRGLRVVRFSADGTLISTDDSIEPDAIAAASDGYLWVAKGTNVNGIRVPIFKRYDEMLEPEL